MVEHVRVLTLIQAVLCHRQILSRHHCWPPARLTGKRAAKLCCAESCVEQHHQASAGLGQSARTASTCTKYVTSLNWRPICLVAADDVVLLLLIQLHVKLEKKHFCTAVCQGKCASMQASE